MANDVEQQIQADNEAAQEVLHDDIQHYDDTPSSQDEEKKKQEKVSFEEAMKELTKSDDYDETKE